MDFKLIGAAGNAGRSGSTEVTSDQFHEKKF